MILNKEYYLYNVFVLGSDGFEELGRRYGMKFFSYGMGEGFNSLERFGLEIEWGKLG